MVLLSEGRGRIGQTVANFVDKTVWTGDNLDILRGMNSESVDLIDLDPPFNSNRPPCRIVVNRDSFRELGLGLSGFCGKVKPCSVNETA